jgi:hypothetical protein
LPDPPSFLSLPEGSRLAGRRSRAGPLERDRVFRGAWIQTCGLFGHGRAPLDRECERAGAAARLLIRAVLCVDVAGVANCYNRDSRRLVSNDDIVATTATTMPLRLRLSLGQLVGDDIVAIVESTMPSRLRLSLGQLGEAALSL